MKVLIAGGGAAGLLAGLAAARAGARVTILEKNDRFGRKLLATGNGRCNLSHRPVLPAAYFSADRDFLDAFIPRWPTDRLLGEFAGLGLACHEENGRIYPRSQRAETVVELLGWHLARLGAEVRTNANITAVRRDGNGFSAELTSGETAIGDRLILATGGAAGPVYGSTGDGYAWAVRFGHTLVPARPALAPLHATLKRLHPLQGLKCIVRAAVARDGREVAADVDEILFTKSGFSGPLAMNLSRHAEPGYQNGLVIDFIPEWEAAELRGWLAAPGFPLGVRLRGLLPARVADRLLAILALDPTRVPAGPDDPALALAASLKEWREPLAGPAGFAEAKVTAGGVSTRELEPRTLASRLVPGLYLAGELLDVDGRSGGHNLHFAFATGLTAGAAAASGSTSQTVIE